MFDGGIRNLLNNPEQAYLVIFILSVLMYKLGFQEHKLPLFKALIVYLVLAVGCIPITTLYMFGLPILEVLILGTIILMIVKFRRKEAKDRSSDQKKPNTG